MQNFNFIEDITKYIPLIKKKSCIAIIPARGGSKTIKDKNIKLLKGKPLIEYSIKHAHLSKKIENVIVSSDSQKILDIASKLGAIPIKRPNNLGNDIIHAEPSLIHALLEYINIKGYLPECTVLLQATSPIRNTEDINSSIDDVMSKKFKSSLAGTATHRFIWGKDNNSSWISPYGSKRPRRQEFSQVTETGSFYTFSTIDFLKKGDRIINPTNIVMTSQSTSYEIDTLSDWKILEALMETI